MSRAGFVLVGGRSSRMGRDKALLPFHGAALAQAVAREVEKAAGETVLVGPSRYASLGYAVVPDLFPGEGPLGAILTALESSAAEWNLVAACDMPDLTAAFLRDLFESAEDKDVDALLPAGPSGLPEPLCAVYHRRALPALRRAFDGGIRKVTAAFGEIRAATLPIPERAPFQNVNTPADWAGYASD